MAEGEDKPKRGRPKKRPYVSARPNPMASVSTPGGIVRGASVVMLTDKEAQAQLEAGNIRLADEDS